MSDREPGVFSQLQGIWQRGVASFSCTIPARRSRMCLIKLCKKFPGLESMQLNVVLRT